MSNDNQQNINNDSDELSLKGILEKVKRGFIYVKSRWIVVLTVSILGALIGFGYAKMKKPVYTAVCTFVLEETKSGGGLGQYAGLASLAGVNIGSGGSGGIFEGNNILELYKSRLMIEKALLSTGTFDGKKQLLIDRYIEKNPINKSEDDELKKIDFNGNPDNFNRKQDSIVTNLVELFNNKILSVSKPDKKLDIIRVEVISKDELFSKCFTEKLVQDVNDFYIQTKTKKQYQAIQILQHQMDSLRLILNSSLNGVASAIDAAPNANPQMSTLRVSSQKRQIDVQTNTAIYSEVVKNLELQKISLRQEMPLIQIVDKPVLPLTVTKTSKLKGLVAGFIVAGFLAIIAVLSRKIYKLMLN